jgi:poly-beta-1,6-N-acetyl-D-glucosamine synthase
MTLLEAVFWLSAACVFYTYVGYPLILAEAARLWPCGTTNRGKPPVVPVSVVVVAFNEEACIGRRVRELSRLLASRPAGGEVIVVSDGSTDRTAEVAQTVARKARSEAGAGVSVRVLALPANVGKAAALNEGCTAASHPLLVFADARQTWAPDTIDRLTENFTDPSIGAVSGDLVVESAPGVMAGVGLYWRFEKWLRRTESRFHSMVSVTGSISAVRCELFRSMPGGTILDDVYWPMVVAMGGHRVVHDEQARAYDRLPDRVCDEFRRKVRTLAGNFQVIARIPSALWPWRNPVWWQFVSHRALRLVVPWALLAMLTASAALGGPVYRAASWGQAAFYIFGLTGLLQAVASRSRLASAIASFLILNAAAWVAFWVWASGRSTRSWVKVRYKAPAPAVAPSSPPPHDGSCGPHVVEVRESECG